MPELLLHSASSDDARHGRQAFLSLAGIACCSLFAFLSKENGAVLAPALLLYDLIFRRRSVFKFVPGYCAALIPAVFIYLWRYRIFSILPVQGFTIVDNPLIAQSFWISRFTACQVLWRYLGLLIWPLHLSWDYSFNQIQMAQPAAGLLAAVVLLLLILGLGAMYRIQPSLAFSGLFFWLALLPTANLVVLIGATMAERFLYLPSVGFAIFFAASIALLYDRIHFPVIRRADLVERRSHRIGALNCAHPRPQYGLDRRRQTMGRRGLSIPAELQDTPLARINSLLRPGTADLDGAASRKPRPRLRFWKASLRNSLRLSL